MVVPHTTNRLTQLAALPLLLAGASCVANRAVVRVHATRLPEVHTVSPQALSSPVDCADREGGSDTGVCDGGAASVLICAHGTATIKASSTNGWRISDGWLKIAATATVPHPTPRCALADQPDAAPEPGHDADGLRVPIAMPLAAARWLSVARALDSFAVDTVDDAGHAWAVLERREQMLDRSAEFVNGEAQEKATRITTKWRSGVARCTTVTELFRDRAMSAGEVARETDGGGQEDAASMDWLESGVTGAFGLKVASHPHLGFVLEAFHEQHVESGLRAGLLSATKLTCSAQSVEALFRPRGFDVSLRLSKTGQGWVASATPGTDL